MEDWEGGRLVGEVAPGSEWTLLLALHLLRELRNPVSAWRTYTELLPAPPGSLLKHVCSQGPDATDLLLFRWVCQGITLWSLSDNVNILDVVQCHADTGHRLSSCDLHFKQIVVDK